MSCVLIAGLIRPVEIGLLLKTNYVVLFVSKTGLGWFTTP